MSEDLSHPVDYNLPFRAQEIFRVSKKKDDNYDEYMALTAFCWEDVRGVDGYFFDNIWQKYTQEKFYVLLAGQAQPKLILGSYKEFLDLWTQMRDRYPLFGEYGDED